jgi:hypothetical protein
MRDYEGAKQFKAFKKFQSFKPPPKSSPAARGGGKRWGLIGLNGLNVLNESIQSYSIMLSFGE